MNIEHNHFNVIWVRVNIKHLIITKLILGHITPYEHAVLATDLKCLKLTKSKSLRLTECISLSCTDFQIIFFLVWRIMSSSSVSFQVICDT